MHQNYIKYNTKTASKSTPYFTGKTCSPLLCYRKTNRTNSCGNAIANSQGLLHAETGFSYFGARYYDSDILTGWLSLDPMADKYPGLSPYAYCAWNPIKLVDPDGRDWYQNELTGAIYYNIKIRGAEAAGTGAMKGDGWKYLGENNMFTTDGFNKSDWDIIRRNNGKFTYDKLSNSFNMELSLDGDRAKSVMESVGYKQVPTQVVTYNDTYTQEFNVLNEHTINVTYGNIYEYTEKVAYFPESYSEIRRSSLDDVYGKIDYIKNNIPYASRQTINYRKTGLNKIFPGLSAIHGGIHNYVNYYNMGNITNYSGNNTLINEILRK
ncbi:MAG: hypothetical protein J6V54_05195 [Bacteroidales bacterium]|nr:hypothetical protein [Bacteroidales bacterium]